MYVMSMCVMYVCRLCYGCMYNCDVCMYVLLGMYVMLCMHDVLCVYVNCVV